MPPRPRKKRPKTPASTLGKKIRALREGLDMTQKELAVRIKATTSTVSRMESEGNFMTEKLWSVAKALRTEVKELFA